MLSIEILRFLSQIEIDTIIGLVKIRFLISLFIKMDCLRIPSLHSYPERVKM